MACWHRVPTTRPRFDVVRHRLRSCAVETGSGSASGGSATTTTAAGCCGGGADGLYPAATHAAVCPPRTACLHCDELPPAAQFHAGPGAVQRCNSVAAASSCPLASEEPHRRWGPPPMANGEAAPVSNDSAAAAPDARPPASRSRQPSEAAAVCGRPCSGGVKQSTASTSVSTTPRSSYYQATKSSSSSASDAKSRRATSSELDRLTSPPQRPR